MNFILYTPNLSPTGYHIPLGEIEGLTLDDGDSDADGDWLALGETEGLTLDDGD